MSFDGNEYDKDQDGRGASHFLEDYSERWAYSSTGVFIGNENTAYIAESTSSLNLMGKEIYQTARVAPNSIRYYGFCLQEGSYRVRLHFAEIMFTNDQTYSSLGKRIFDVSIQVSEGNNSHCQCSVCGLKSRLISIIRKKLLTIIWDI